MHLDEDYGEGTAIDIMLQSNQPARFTNDELLEKIKYFEKLVKEIS
jgi:hypothetical protein